MRKLLGIGATLLGGLGLILCIIVIGLSWWVASKAVDRIDTIALRLDERLTHSGARLARIEERVTTAQTELADVRRDAESITVTKTEAALVRGELDRLRSRLIPVLDQLSATADSLLALSDALNAVADLLEQLTNDAAASARLRNAAGAIDRAAISLEPPQEKVEAVVAAGAIELRKTELALVAKVIEGSDLLAQGLAAAREESVAARQQIAEYRDGIVSWISIGATAVMLLALWGGLGQWCLCRYERNREWKANADLSGQPKHA
jgi:hypothetical protein